MFPPELTDKGFSQEALSSAVTQVRTGSADCSWKLHGTPTIGFYRKLHTYLKSQPNLSKVLIGKLYSAIDPSFQEKASRSDNTYRFVENIVQSERQSDNPMLYNIPIVKSTTSMLKKCSQRVEELNDECTMLRKKVEASRTKLQAMNRALRDVTNENHHLMRKCEQSRAKTNKLELRNEQLESECAQLEFNLQSNEEGSDSDVSSPATAESTFQDINGHHKYSPEIKKLYYSLLADQVAISKTTIIIQSLIEC